MTIFLILLVSTHVFLLLTAAIAFYAMLLQLLAKRGVNKKMLLWSAVVGFITSIFSWVISIVYLSDYYLGKEGYNTGYDVTTLIPKFVYVREILLPLLVVTALLVFIGVWLKGEHINEEAKLKKEEEETKRDKQHAVRACTKIYQEKGLSGDLLKRVVNKICSNKKVMLKTLMKEEWDLSLSEHKNPVMEAVVIGVSAIIGSLIPLAPFFFIPVSTAIWVSLIASIATLFITGAVKAKLTVGSWFRSGLEVTLIGMGAALLGFIIGLFFSGF